MPGSGCRASVNWGLGVTRSTTDAQCLCNILVFDRGALLNYQVCRRCFEQFLPASYLYHSGPLFENASFFRRQEVRRIRRARYRTLEAPMGKAVPFQTAWRGFIARKALRLLREAKEEEWHAAVLLQRAWYRRVKNCYISGNTDNVVCHMWQFGTTQQASCESDVPASLSHF